MTQRRGFWPLGATCTELLSPRREMGAVDAFLAKECFESAAHTAADRSLGGGQQALLLGRGEPTTSLLGFGFHGCSARTKVGGRTLFVAGHESDFQIRLLRWLRHVRDTILRPSVQRYPEETVSRDVGTEGADSGVGARRSTRRGSRSRAAFPLEPS
jgi:hypothetical protein